MSRLIYSTAVVLLVSGITACGEDTPPPPKTEKPVAPVVKEPESRVDNERLVRKIQSEMESLRIERDQAQREKSRLEQEVTTIEQAINESDEKADRIESRIEKMEK